MWTQPSTNANEVAARNAEVVRGERRKTSPEARHYAVARRWYFRLRIERRRVVRVSSSCCAGSCQFSTPVIVVQQSAWAVRPIVGWRSLAHTASHRVGSSSALSSEALSSTEADDHLNTWSRIRATAFRLESDARQ